MNGISLTTPYLDTDADQLSFSLEQGPLDALAVREVSVGTTAVQLRLLGASHQVLTGPVCETVACLPDVAGGLPGSAAREFDGWSYRFGARVERLDGDRFGERVAWILDRSHGDPAALYGVFPGSPEAVTALCVERRASGLSWRTWHTYPQSRQIVATHTRLEAR
ncbi:DUF2617 family protein [Streptomyces genisteinicus]|uniref:DUF2617 family protein n=1 Tax=Streptomyces genisteinicus TaxID=2768068 RepID=A0A7H0HNE4_9ACTN|nr:DUF2617 family protein [Streptomyces genisteinicus]QNP62060.1 DUF2617 family protein [Streptomyces genisteinicus]